MSLVLASRATVYDRYSVSRRFTAQETAINIVQGNISLLVSESEITELKNGNKTMYSRLSAVEVNLNSITLAVSSSEYKNINGVLSAITQARASITVNSQQIELKVSKNSVISSINQSAEAVQIAANKIALTGNGLISILNTGTTTISASRINLTGNGIINILNTGTTTINASRINLNGIVTANQNFKIIADGSMEAKNGKFNGSLKSENAEYRSSVSIENGIISVISGNRTVALLYASSSASLELFDSSGNKFFNTEPYATDIYNHLTVSGIGYFNSDVQVNKELIVLGNLRVSGDLYVKGKKIN